MTAAYPVTSTTKLPKPRRRWLTVLLALFIFASGAFVGGAVALKIVVYRVRQAVIHPEKLPANLTARLNRRLDLDPAQSSQVEAILTARLGHIQALRKQVQPQVSSELIGAHDDIGRVLRPDQQGKWNALFTELTKDWLPAGTAGPTTRP